MPRAEKGPDRGPAREGELRRRAEELSRQKAPSPPEDGSALSPERFIGKTVHDISAKHGGSNVVESTLGAGSTFTLHFPAAAATGLPPEAASPAPAALSGRILIMDDEASVVLVLKRILQRLGCQADAVHDGRAALDAYRRAREAGQPYAAVIMDLTIPGGMGGKEAIGRFAALAPGVKAVVSSGYANDPILSDYAAHGLRGVLAKPYRLAEVAEVLRGILAP